MYTFIESPLFSKLVHSYLSDAEYVDLQWCLASNPSLGDLIKGSDGIRKIRFSAKGKGKRGGVRIIYYWRDDAGEIWLLTIYAKNEAETIPTNVLRKIKEQFQ